MDLMNQHYAKTWVARYEKAWRSADLSLLDTLFTKDIRYQVSPWKKPITGLHNLRQFWSQSRSGPDEAFSLHATVVTADEALAVVRVEVTYTHDTPAKWRDLWIIQFDSSGHCSQFEEWPFSEKQTDGQASPQVGQPSAKQTS